MQKKIKFTLTCTYSPNLKTYGVKTIEEALGADKQALKDDFFGFVDAILDGQTNETLEIVDADED